MGKSGKEVFQRKLLVNDYLNDEDTQGEDFVHLLILALIQIEIQNSLIFSKIFVCVEFSDLKGVSLIHTHPVREVLPPLLFGNAISRLVGLQLLLNVIFCLTFRIYYETLLLDSSYFLCNGGLYFVDYFNSGIVQLVEISLLLRVNEVLLRIIEVDKSSVCLNLSLLVLFHF